MRKCDKCGRYSSIQLIWPLITLAVIIGLGIAIHAIVQNNNQNELRKQYLVGKMSPAWQTMYYVLQKVDTPHRGDVMTEFIGRAPQFFEGQRISSEQMDLFLDLFLQNSIPEVLSHINPTMIKQQD